MNLDGVVLGGGGGELPSGKDGKASDGEGGESRKKGGGWEQLGRARKVGRRLFSYIVANMKEGKKKDPKNRC